MAEQNQIQNYQQELDVEDYTPSVATTAGVPLEIGGKAAFANNDIAADEKGAVQVSGLVKVVQAAEIISKGDDVWWDNDGDPVGGTAGTGAATGTPQAAANGFLLGVARVTTAATDATVVVDLNGKYKAASVAAAAGTDAAIIDAIADAMRANGLMAGA